MKRKKNKKIKVMIMVLLVFYFYYNLFCGCSILKIPAVQPCRTLLGVFFPIIITVEGRNNNAFAV